jgi:hypothetical protein
MTLTETSNAQRMIVSLSRPGECTRSLLHAKVPVRSQVELSSFPINRSISEKQPIQNSLSGKPKHNESGVFSLVLLE